MPECAYCGLHSCKLDPESLPNNCPGNQKEIHKKALELFNEEENKKIAQAAAKVEKRGYGRKTRLEEIIDFCHLCDYQKLGLVFCTGLSREAKIVADILKHHGFEICSVICKTGSIPKADIGLKAEDTLRNCSQEVMCNPIGQALLMNENKVDFTIILGLCVGHDTLVIKYLESPTTVLAVKDRVTGHNPLAAIYLADSYYHKRFYGEKKD